MLALKRGLRLNFHRPRRMSTYPDGRASLHKLEQLRLGCARISQHEQVDVPPAGETIGQPEKRRETEELLRA